MRQCLLLRFIVTSCLLAACGGGPSGGATLPPVSASPSVTASSSASAGPPASVPPEATAATTQGAEAFVRFYIETVTRAYLTRDPSLVERLSVPTCDGCQRYIKSIRELVARDATVGAGYAVAVTDVLAPQVPMNARTVTVTVVARVGPFVATTRDGTVLVNGPAQDRLVQDLTLERSSTAWLVAGIKNP